MSVIWGILGLLFVVVWLVSVSDIVRRHLGTKRTSAWLLIVTILPIAGAAIYWALRKPSDEDRRGAGAESGDTPLDGERMGT